MGRTNNGPDLAELQRSSEHNDTQPEENPGFSTSTSHTNGNTANEGPRSQPKYPRPHLQNPLAPRSPLSLKDNGGKPYDHLRPRRHPSWTCACANCASTRASSRCAWPNAWPSSCRPSSRRPSCARHVSWAPWFGRLGTTGAGQLLQTTRGEAQRNELKLKGRLDVHTNTPETQQSRQFTRTRPQHNNQDQGNHLMCACFFF